MSLSLVLSSLLFSACGSQAGVYVVAPAPVWAPSPTPQTAASEPAEGFAGASGQAGATSPTPSPAKKKKGAPTDTETPTSTITPTPTLTPTPGTGFYLVPLQDKRKNAAIWTGRSVYEKVVIEAEGRTLFSKAWADYGDIAFLWHRQFTFALANNGYLLQSSEEPLMDPGLAMAAAKQSGARYLISGEIKRLSIAKKGADSITGTNFSGTNFHVNLELHLKVLDAGNGQTALERKVEFQRMFYDPTRLGSEERDTFPRFFAVGLPELAVMAAGDQPLRQLAGLPAYTPTFTATATPEIRAPKAGDVEPSLTPTPDLGPYWINPKTGKKADPAWNFDPTDGTPRKEFILIQPGPPPAPGRATEQK